ncbi:Uncharacterized protein dnm_032510 [Desulfonema magnum]|uniref:Uncharacterized protein n=1 Tax=Desulfonema magnum TaxID=45655 RepID=A0A975GMR5_9BACT|nr:Uncharacterized protein dnm_032510 [Desulfonema magnum]
MQADMPRVSESHKDGMFATPKKPSLQDSGGVGLSYATNMSSLRDFSNTL